MDWLPIEKGTDTAFLIEWMTRDGTAGAEIPLGNRCIAKGGVRHPKTVLARGAYDLLKRFVDWQAVHIWER